MPEEEEGADVALITKNFWQKRLGGDPNVIGRSITLDGMAHTVVGVLPNMPASVVWSESDRRSLDDKTVPASRIQLRTNDARHQFSPRGWTVETAVTVKQARAALPSLDHSYGTQYPNKIDSTLHNDAQDVATGRNGEYSSGFRHTFRRGHVLSC